MARCDVCGNDYARPMQIRQGDRTGTFDSFDCAIHALAPRCAHCGCQIIGHGVEDDEHIYCCGHCAQTAGAKSVHA